MRRTDGPEPLLRLCSAVVAAAIGASASMIWPHSSLAAKTRVLIGLAVLLVSLTPAHWLMQRSIAALRELPSRVRRVAMLGSLLGGVVIVLAWPFRPPELGARGAHRLVVTATGNKSAEAKGQEVWLIDVLQDEESIRSAGTQTGVWRERDGNLVANEKSTMSWEGSLTGQLRVVFIKHPWSGLVTISWDGVESTTDLYSPSSDSVAIALGSGPQPSSPGAFGWLLKVAWSIDLAFVFTIIFAFIAHRSRALSEAATKIGLLDFLVPAVTVFVILAAAYWTAFFPALMSNDSIDQWRQLESLELTNGHPAFHTMLNWLVTRLWHSPGAVSLFQIALFASCIGVVMRELGHWSVPFSARWVVSALVALSPVNGVLVMSLWKDVPFTVVVIFISAILLKLARTADRPWPTSMFVAGFVALLSLSLLRHNGFLITLSFVALLPFVSKPDRLKAAAVLVASLGGYFVISGPVYAALGVKPLEPVFRSTFQIEMIGALLQSDPQLSEDDRSTLSEIEPLDKWKSRYTCYQVNPLMFTADLNRRFFEDQNKTSRFQTAWWHLAKQNPEELIRHQLCISSMLWSVHPTEGGYLYTFQSNIAANEFELKSDSLWPTAKESFIEYLSWSRAPRNIWWAWRPALYLYFALFAATCAMIRARRLGIWAFVMPTLSQIVTLALVIPAQDFRYAYTAYVVGLLSVLLFFVKPPATR